MVTKDLGPVSAYALAVVHGYMGTEEEWAVLQAQAGTNAQAAAKSAEEAAQAAANAAQAAADGVRQAVKEDAAKAEEAAALARSVKDSIPEDYAELSAEVDRLSADVAEVIAYPENVATFSEGNHKTFGGDATFVFNPDGFTMSHGSTNYSGRFKLDGLDVGERYTLAFTTSTALYGAWVTSMVDDIDGTGYAISDVLESLEAGTYTLTFVPVKSSVGFSFRVRYNVPTVTLSGVVCKKDNAVNSVNIDCIPQLPVQKIDFDNPGNPALYPGKEFLAFNKCLCIGDSLTEGVFDHDEAGTLEYVVLEQYSYPAQMTKIYGIETTNMGIGGLTAQQWLDRNMSADLSGHDVCVIALGTNDTLQGVPKADTKAALSNIIQRVKAENNKIAVFLCTLLPAYYSDDDAHNATNEAIRETANENDACHLIDLTAYSECKKGTKYAQGHLTALGYLKEACEIVAIGGHIIRSSETDEFRHIQFINTDFSHS